MSKLHYGIGFNSGETYKVSENRRAYKVWRNMLERCYSPRYQSRYPTYIGCSVHSDWHDFQVFAEWFLNHDYVDLGYQLDKDLLFPKNKMYESSKCCLVPRQINSLLLDNRASRGELPQGVCLKKRDNTYMASLRLSGVNTHLGYFDCPTEAYQVYKTAKEANVKRMALEWQDRIADNVFQALMNWELV